MDRAEECSVMMRHPIGYYFGQRLRVAMARKNMRGPELAKRLGISRAFICETQNGKKFPCSSNLVAISKELGVSLDWLMRSAELDFVTGPDNRQSEIDNEH